VKSLNYLLTVSELRLFRYHVCTIKVLINKRVYDHVTYSTSIGNSFQPCAHMYTITCGQLESFCLSEKYLRSLEAPLVQNSTWRGKSNASLIFQCSNTSLHKLTSMMTNREKYRVYFLHFHDLLAAILDFHNSGDDEKMQLYSSMAIRYS